MPRPWHFQEPALSEVEGAGSDAGCATFLDRSVMLTCSLPPSPRTRGRGTPCPGRIGKMSRPPAPNHSHFWVRELKVSDSPSVVPNHTQYSSLPILRLKTF